MPVRLSEAVNESMLSVESALGMVLVVLVLVVVVGVVVVVVGVVVVGVGVLIMPIRCDDDEKKSENQP